MFVAVYWSSMPDKSMAPKIYLAGPDVFLPDPLSIAKMKKDLCVGYGFAGVFPLDAEFDSTNLKKREQGLQISRNNENLIRSCDLLIANMTPFRSPTMDVGTAFELGFARALGKPVLDTPTMQGGSRIEHPNTLKGSMKGMTGGSKTVMGWKLKTSI